MKPPKNRTTFKRQAGGLLCQENEIWDEEQEEWIEEEIEVLDEDELP